MLYTRKSRASTSAIHQAALCNEAKIGRRSDELRWRESRRRRKKKKKKKEEGMCVMDEV